MRNGLLFGGICRGCDRKSGDGELGNSGELGRGRTGDKEDAVVRVVEERVCQNRGRERAVG